MLHYESEIRRFIRERQWEANIEFSCDADSLHYHDSRYGSPAATLRKKNGTYILESRRDAQRGVLLRQEYGDGQEAVTAFMDLMEYDFCWSF